jgi:hypothetical protein
MRQLAIATAFGVVGLILAVLIVGFVAKDGSSISDRWLVAGAVLNVIGMVIGAVLAPRFSKGTDPWPIVELRRRIPYILVGALIGALNWYACYVQLAAVWNHVDYWTLFFDPNLLPTLSSTGRSGRSTDAPVLMYIILGALAGGWVTDSGIKKKWTQ